MKSCLGIFRTLFSLFLSVLLFTVIVIGIPFGHLTNKLANSKNLKSWLDETSTYKKLSETFVNELQNKIEPDSQTEVENRERIADRAGNIITDQLLKQNFEDILDDTYKWLQGDSDVPEFSIDIESIRESLVSEFTIMTVENLKNLPPCTTEQMSTINQFNPLRAECLPPDYDFDNTEEIENKIREELEKENLISQDEITYMSIAAENTVLSKFYNTASDSIKRLYSILTNLLKIVLIVIIIISIGIFATIPKLSNKFFLLGFVLTISSVFLIFSNYYINSNFDKFLNKTAENFSTEKVELIKDILKEPLKLAISDTFSDVRGFAFILIVMGLIMMFGGVLLRRPKKYYIEDDQEDRSDSFKQNFKNSSSEEPVNQKQ